MPSIVALPDGTEVEVPDTATPEQRAAFKDKLRAKYAPADDGNPISRAAGYVGGRAKQWAGALARVTGLPGLPNPSVGQVAGDVATVAAPVIAPVPTLLDVGAGAVARGAGASEDTANLIGAGAGIGTGVVQGVRAGARAVKAAGDLVTPGQVVRETVPAGSRQAVKGFQASRFDPVFDYAKQQGLGLDPGSPAAEKFAAAILRMEDWGDKIPPAAMAMADKLTSPTGARVLTGEIDDFLKQIPSRFGPLRGATEKAIGESLGQTSAAAAYKAALKDWGKTATQVQKLGGSFRNMLPGAATRRLVKLWDDMTPEARRMADPTGEVAGLVEQARQMRKRSAILTATIGGGTMVTAGNRLIEGDIGGAFKALGIGVASAAGARYAGDAATFLRGAAGPTAAGIAGVGGSAAARSAAPPDTAPSDAPHAAPGPAIAPIAPEAAPAPSPAPEKAQAAAPQLEGPFAREIEAVASTVGLPSSLLRVIIAQESGGRAQVVSRPQAGQVQTPARGLMQVTPGTFAGVKPRVEALTGRPASVDDPLDNLVGGALLWKQYLDQSEGDLAAAARLYHGGENLRYHGPQTLQYGKDIVKRYARAVGGGG